MGKSRGNGAVEEFDKHLAHAVVARAIHQICTSGAVVTRGQRDWMYRMGMVGIMAAYVARGEDAPGYVRTALVKGTPLSTKDWRILLGEDSV